MIKASSVLGAAVAFVSLAGPAHAADRGDLLDEIVSAYSQHQLARDIFAQATIGKTPGAIPPRSLEDLRSEAAYAQGLLRALDTVPDARLKGERLLTARSLRWLLNSAGQEVDDYFFVFPTPYNLPELNFVNTALEINPLASAADRQDYLALVDSVTTRLAVMRTQLKDQQAKGVRMPKAQVPRAVTAIEGLKERANAWSAVSAERLSRIPAAEQASFVAAAAVAVRRAQDAFAALAAELGPDYLAAAPETAGLYQYPGGKAYYEKLVERTTTYAAKPDEMRSLGRRLLERNTRELDQLVADMAIPGGRAGLRDYVNTQPRFIAQKPEDVADKFNRCLLKVVPNLPKFFGRLPKAPYRPFRLDPANEKGMTFGYYEPPTPGNAYGQYRFNGSDLSSRSLVTACPIIYHELMPGHHLQVALQSEASELPVFRRTAIFTAHTEGWAEYASSLAREMGGYTDRDDLLGRLMFNSFIYSRLIVDTGLNYDGWTLEQARTFLRQNTYISDAEISSEVLRYSADIPSQALAYGAGSSAILELRRELEHKLGRKFDIRRFHDELVGHGALPIEVITGYVRQTMLGGK
jgi:uncharacterized protein (DUF885 family)